MWRLPHLFCLNLTLLVVIYSVICVVKSSGSQSLVEDEVNRFMNGIKRGNIHYSQNSSSNFSVIFHLCSFNGSEIINATDSSILTSSFKPSLHTKVIIHGYRPFFNEMPTWVPKLVEQIHTFDLVNVITVNWLDGVNTDYVHARKNARRTGESVAELLNTIFDVYEHYEASKVHVIGFSLGGQAAGFTGKELSKLNRTRILGRITGLDPAGPGFNVNSPNYRLDKRDAMFVDVIHTDATAAFEFELGLNRDVGHVDFYPNGGSHQAGCTRWKDIKFDRDLAQDMVRYVSCDHTRAVAFFVHSVNSSLEHSFKAYRCKNFERFQKGKCFSCHDEATYSASLGYWLEKRDVPRQGRYYLLTTSDPPYCGNHYKLELRWSSSRRRKRDLFGFGKKLKYLANFHQSTVYISVSLIGVNGDTVSANLDRGESISISPGEITKHVFTCSCIKDIAEISAVKISVTGNWLTRYLDAQDDLVIARGKVIALESRKTYSSQYVTKEVLESSLVYTLNVSGESQWECNG